MNVDEKIQEFFSKNRHQQSKPPDDVELIISLLELVIAHLKQRTNNSDLNAPLKNTIIGVIPHHLGACSGQQTENTVPPQGTWLPPVTPHKNDVFCS